MPTVSKFKSVEYIISARHYGGAKEYILRTVSGIAKARNIVLPVVFDPSSDAVFARIWQGQWIADCECGGASFVEADEPIFFCFSCGNRRHGGRVRRVAFPENLEIIEALMLQRPVDDMAGLDDKERAGLAKPLILVEGKGGLSRNWNTGQSIDEIKQENTPIEKWHKELVK